MAQYFIFSVGTLWRNNLHYIKHSVIKSHPWMLYCWSVFQRQTHFSFVIQPQLWLEQYMKKTRNITAYILFLCLSDQDNCKHMKRVIGKQIVFVLLHQICFILHHSICTLLIHWQSLAIIGCFRLRTSHGQRPNIFFALIWKKKKTKKHEVNRDNAAGVAPTQQYLYSSHKYGVVWSVQWKEKPFTPCKLWYLKKQTNKQPKIEEVLFMTWTQLWVDTYTLVEGWKQRSAMVMHI